MGRFCTGAGDSPQPAARPMLGAVTQTLSSTASSTPDGACPATWPTLTSSDASLRRFLHGLPGVDQVGAEARAAVPRHPVDQDHRQGLRPRPRDPDGRPDHARGRRHPGQGARAVRQGDAPRPGRPVLPAPRPRSASTPTWSPTAKRDARRLAACTSPRSPPRSRRGRAALDIKLADTRDAVEAGADEIDMVIDRGAFLSGRYLEVFEEIVAVARGVRRPTVGAHLKVIFETGELQTYDNVRRASLAGDDGRRALHQDLHRQGPAGRDAAGDAGDARGGPRLPRGHRPDGRREAGRRHPHRQGRDQVPRDGQRGRRRRTGSTPTGSASAPPRCSTTC